MTPRFPRITADEIGWLTECQMIEVDRVMIDELKIGLIQMMENAGRNLAQLVLERFGPSTVTVLAGSGGNGGGGLVAARHLANRGVDVSVALGQPAAKFTPVPAHQPEILQRMGVPTASRPRRSDVDIDALIGYSLNAPRGLVGELSSAIGGIGEQVRPKHGAALSRARLSLSSDRHSRARLAATRAERYRPGCSRR